MLRLILVQSVCWNHEWFKERTPTPVAALVIVAVVLAGDVIVTTFVLVAVGAFVVFALHNCRGRERVRDVGKVSDHACHWGARRYMWWKYNMFLLLALRSLHRKE